MQPNVQTPNVDPNSSTARLDFAKGITDSYLASDAQNGAKVDDARSKLVDYYSNLEDPTARYQRISKDQGLDQQQKLVDSLTRNVMDTEDSIDAVTPSVNGRTKDFLVNDTNRSAIIAREKQPLLDTLTKLTRSQEYASVGLQGKQQMVSTLLQLATQGDAQKAKPLELGVDYSEKDREVANQIFSTILSTQTGAFNADVSDAAAEKRQQEQQSFEAQQNELNRAATTANNAQQGAIQQSNQTSLEQLKKSLGNDAYTQAGSGGGTPKTSQQSVDAWNNILANNNIHTENDVWKYINQNQQSLKAQGVDVNYLWSQHSALAAKVGFMGEIR